MNTNIKNFKKVKNYFGKTILIPDHWNYNKYDDLLIEVEDPVIFNDDEEYPLITAKRGNEGLILREIKKGEDIKTKNLFNVNVGDFIIAKMQIIHGACGLVPKSLAKAKISGSYLRFQANEKLDLEYLNWLSRTQMFYQSTFISSVGTNLEKMSFNKDHWLNLKIPLPPIKEQREIVIILNSTEFLIEKAEKIIHYLKKIKKGLMQKLMSEGFNEKSFQITEIGKIPKRWNLVNLEEVSEISTGSTPPTSESEYYEGKIPFILTTAIKNNIIRNSSINVSEKAVADSNLKIYPPKTVFMAMYGQGQTRGRVAILETDATTSQNTGAIETKELLDPYFLWYYLQNQYENLRGTGIIGQISHLNLGFLKKLKIPLPTNAEQKKMVEILESVDNKIEHYDNKIIKIETMKKGLMQKLLTGEIKVKS